MRLRRLLNRLSQSWRSLTRRQSVEREIDDELQSALELLTDRKMAEGADRRTAARHARIELTGLTQVTEDVRRARFGIALTFDALRQDLRGAMRQFAARPLMTATMAATLALGLGLNLLLYTLIYSARVSPVPGLIRDASLVRVRMFGFDSSSTRMSGAAFESLRQQQIFDAIAAESPPVDVRVGFGSADESGATAALFVSPNYFDVLRVPMLAGHAFSNSRSAVHDDEAVIGVRLWQELFQGRADAIGRSLRVNGRSVTVIGVVPDRFRGVNTSSAVPGMSRDTRPLWLPLESRRTLLAGAEGTVSLDAIPVLVAARLKQGRTVGDTAPLIPAPMDVVLLAASTTHPRDLSQLDVIVAGLGAIALLILAITCTNVGSLLAARLAGRRAELALRLSLGAGRGRLVRQLLTETALLVGASAAVGVWALWGAGRWLQTAVPVFDLVYDPSTIAMTATLAAVASVLVGLSPALRATRLAALDPARDLPQAMSGDSKAQRRFVVFQIAFTQPLLVGLVSLLAMNGLSAPVRPSPLDARVAVLTMSVFGARLDASEISARIRARFASVPGIEELAETSSGYQPIRLAPPSRSSAWRLPVSLNFFALRDAHIVRGRPFLESDVGTQDTAAIIGSDALGDVVPGREPIGAHLRVGDRALTIVGVVDAGSLGGTFHAGSPEIFVPMRREDRTRSLLIRTSGPAVATYPMIRDAVRAAVPTERIARLTTIAADREERRDVARLASAAAGFSGVATLGLAAIGLFAIVAFDVSSRTREIGLRIALGARRQDTVWLFFARGLRLTASGMLLGLPVGAIAYGAVVSRVVGSPVPTASVAAAVAGAGWLVAILAVWFPAQRAAAVDPAISLRS